MKINPQKIDWKSDDSYFFTNPKKTFKFDLSLLKNSDLKGHLFFMSSGTQHLKCVSLSKKAFLTSAKAVNEHLKATDQDTWQLSLPLFHVGGCSILARSFLSQSTYFIWEKKWNPQLFVKEISKNQATLTSLVPTQVYDLVLNCISAPPSLRAVVVGGDFLSPSLYQRARNLKWPLLPSYGSTELCSQIATASLGSLNQNSFPLLKVLSHCQVQLNKEGRIRVQSTSLFTKAFFIDFKTGQIQKKISAQGFWQSEDKGEIKNSFLKIQGRQQSVKVRGEKVSLYELQDVLTEIVMDAKSRKLFQIRAHSHPRWGHQIDLVSTEKDFNLLLEIRNQFNRKIGKNEHIQNCYYILDFPKTALFKTQTKKLQKQLGF